MELFQWITSVYLWTFWSWFRHFSSCEARENGMLIHWLCLDWKRWHHCQGILTLQKKLLYFNLLCSNQHNLTTTICSMKLLWKTLFNVMDIECSVSVFTCYERIPTMLWVWHHRQFMLCYRRVKAVAVLVADRQIP